MASVRSAFSTSYSTVSPREVFRSLPRAPGNCSDRGCGFPNPARLLFRAATLGQLFVGLGGVVQASQRRTPGLAVVGLQAEHAVHQGIVPLSSSRDTVRNPP